MRILMKVKLPHKAFNNAVKKGNAGKKMRAILEEMKPEAVYFTEMEGCRTAIIVVDLEKPSMVPSLAEPWFLTFNADVGMHVVMSPEEVEEAGLDNLGERWA